MTLISLLRCQLISMDTNTSPSLSSIRKVKLSFLTISSTTRTNSLIPTTQTCYSPTQTSPSNNPPTQPSEPPSTAAPPIPTILINPTTKNTQTSTRASSTSPSKPTCPGTQWVAPPP